MKPRPFFYTLVSIVLALLLVGAIGAYWLTLNSPRSLLQGGVRANPAAAMFVSRQSPLMVSLLVNPERLESFWLTVAPPRQRQSLRSELKRFRQNLAIAPLNYDRDLKPWLGNEMTLALTSADVDRDRANGLQPGYLLAVTSKDATLAEETIQQFWQRQAAGADLVFEQYAGVTLIHAAKGKAKAQIQEQVQEQIQPDEVASDSADPTLAEIPTPAQPPTPSLTTAIVGDFVLFANYPKVLRDAVNNVQVPDLNLSSSSAYQTALEQLSDRRIGLTFVSLPQLAAWLAESQEADLSRLITDLDISPQFDSLVASLELEPQGLLADVSLLPSTGKTLASSRPALSTPVGALQYIPATTSLFAAGKDLESFWTQLDAGLGQYGALADWVKRPLQEAQQQWQIDLPDSVFPWVKGEYALGWVPRSNAKQGDWIFVAEQSADTTTGLEQLDAIAQSQGISVGSFDLDEQKIFAWTKLSPTATSVKLTSNKPASVRADVEGVRTTTGNYEIFATSLEALTEALAAPSQSLHTTTDFAAAIAPLDENNNGYLYLDRGAMLNFLQQVAPRSDLAKARIFDSVRSLTVSSYGSTANEQRGAVFIRLKGAAT